MRGVVFVPRTVGDRRYGLGIEFGWLHGFGRSAQSCITPHALEYVLSRGAAWGCPFSMTVSLEQLKKTPRTESCFDVIKTWEDSRIEGKLTDAQRRQFENLDQEHHSSMSKDNTSLFLSRKSARWPAARRQGCRCSAGLSTRI